MNEFYNIKEENDVFVAELYRTNVKGKVLCGAPPFNKPAVDWNHFNYLIKLYSYDQEYGDRYASYYIVDEMQLDHLKDLVLDLKENVPYELQFDIEELGAVKLEAPQVCG